MKIRAWRRVTVAEVMAASGETATPPRHKLPFVPLGGPLQRRRTTRLPAPPRRERPPDLIADEAGVQLYGSRWYDRGQLAIGRLRSGEGSSVRVEAPFAISSVLVHNLGTIRLAVVSGDTDPLTQDAIGFVPAGGWVTLPVGGVRVIRVGTITGANVDGQVVVIALDRVLAPGAGLHSVILDAAVSSVQTREGLPFGSALEDSAAGAAAAITATLAAAAGETTFISGFAVTGAGATAASVIEVTVTGLAVTLRYKLAIPVGAAVGVAPLVVRFRRALPASAPNTAIVVNVPSFGAGNTDAAVAVDGHRA